MVFSPLTFMPAHSALEVLTGIIGHELRSRVVGRHVLTHDLSFWPRGLYAAGWAGGPATTCEPDVVARFVFDSGAPLVVVGEMKWDWRVTPDHLKNEIDRQRAAIRSAYPDEEQVVFAVTKFRLLTKLPDVTRLTWRDVHITAALLAERLQGQPAGRWGELVGVFLERAEQLAFQGFHRCEFQATRSGPIFWRDIDA